MIRHDFDMDKHGRRFNRVFNLAFGIIVTTWVIAIAVIVLGIIFLGDDLVRLIGGLADKVSQ